MLCRPRACRELSVSQICEVLARKPQVSRCQESSQSQHQLFDVLASVHIYQMKTIGHCHYSRIGHLT